MLSQKQVSNASILSGFSKNEENLEQIILLQFKRGIQAQCLTRHTMAKEFWIGDVQEGAHDGAEVELKGWVKRTRGSNKIRFVVLRDSTGTIQCVAKRETLGDEAFEELNLKDNVSKEINRAWLNLALERQEFNFFKKKYRNKTILIASERIDFLLWNGMTSQAKRVINYLDKDIRTLAKARISLRSQSYGVDSLISKVPANLKEDPGLAYERFIWRARKGRIDSATEILKTHSQSKETLKFPLKWSRKRRDYARQAMRDNKSELAYYLASNHFVSGGSDYADLEWLAAVSYTHLRAHET